MKIKLNPLFFIVFILMALLGYLTEYVLILISIILHELGHIGISLLFGWQVHGITILPAGLKASVTESGCSKIKNILIYLSGPCVNVCIILAGIFLWNINFCDRKITETIILSNIYLLIFNMLPVLPMDGGKALREFLSCFFGLYRADAVIKKVSLFIVMLIMFFGLFQFIENPRNFTLIAVGTYLLYVMKTEKTEAALMSMRNILYRHKRLQKKGIYPLRSLAVLKQTKLGEVFKNIDYDCFHLIHVLDKNLSIVKVFTEKEIIDAMVLYNAEISFEELINESRKK